MSSNRDTTVHDLTLSAIADDYENFDHILTTVDEAARHGGIVVDSDQIRRALFDLIERGFAKTYVVSLRHEFDEIDGPPSPDRLQGWNYGFLITEQGKRYLQANPVLDEEGRLRTDRARRS